MKNRITTINIQKLNNGDYYQFIENVVTIANLEPSTASIMQEINEDIPLMKVSFKKEKLNEETKKVIEIDTLRDRSIMKLNFKLKSESYNDSSPEHIAAANRLLLVLKTFGGGALTAYDYNKETAYITNLVDALLAKPNDLTTLNLFEDVEYIKDTNLRFQAIYKDRGDVMGDMKNVIPFYRLRKTIDVHYKDLMQTIESLQKFLPNNAPQISALIDRINVEIEKFKLLVRDTPSVEKGNEK